MTREPAEPPSAESRRSCAFGLDIRSQFHMPGLAPCQQHSGGRTTRVELATADAIARDWPASGWTRVLEELSERGEADRAIDSHPRAGYRLHARGFGVARVSPNGARIVCAPPAAPGWDWQRFLVGRILPWAAVLRGLEVLHASAVAINGRVLAFIGPTGAGKTSLAVQLVYRGARFVTDDVLALSLAGDELLAHQGASIASVRPAERAAIGPERWPLLGQELGENGKSYVELDRVTRPLPLSAVYFLTTGDRHAPEPMPAPDPRLLLASTFVLGVQTPRRLRNQLDVCAAIARSIPSFTLPVGPGVSSAELAAAVAEDWECIG